MPFSPRQIAAHWIPGFTLVAILFLADKQNGEQWLKSIGVKWDTGLALLVIGAAGFIAGNFLDAIRDLCVDAGLDGLRRDKTWPYKIEWDFILHAPADKVERVYDFYFAPYVLSANLVLALLLGGIADLVLFPIRFPLWGWLLGSFIALVFVQDALRLRGCIVKDSRKLAKERKPMP